MIQTMRFEAPAQAIKFISHLVAAKVQFTCTWEGSETLVCYPTAEEVRVGREREQLDLWQRAVMCETESREPL